jgi:hypothetical protein
MENVIELGSSVEVIDFLGTKVRKQINPDGSIILPSSHYLNHCS